jgi:hypothetical protein
MQIIQYLVEHQLVQGAESVMFMLLTADAHGHLAAVQWLKGQEAEWPVVLYYRDTDDTLCQWSGEVLAWARANGCTSPTASVYLTTDRQQA